MIEAPLGQIETALAAWLAQGRHRIGQVLIRAGETGGYSLCHRDDAARPDLREHSGVAAALAIALNDDAEAYRPLKTAPNLRHGWRLAAPDLPALRLALDALYPGRLGAYLLWSEGRLAATPLRETLGRQTGMYRSAGRLTEEQAAPLVSRFCRSGDGCLRTLLWAAPPPTQLPPEKFDPAHDQTGAGHAVIPLLCQEACNLLVAEAREVVKGKAPA